MSYSREVKIDRPSWISRFQWFILKLIGMQDDMKDYIFMLDEVPKVYGHITGGMLSYPNYFADGVIRCADEYMEKCIQDALKDEYDFIKDFKEECACKHCNSGH